MVADSVPELVAFADKIGVKRHFLDRRRYIHYDITSEQHAIALQNGAKLVTSREILQLSKNISLGV